MSYLFFLDESGHDHRQMPYEVRGGIVLHADKLWPFVQNLKRVEESCFGDVLHNYNVEIKGHRLLDKDRFKWASQDTAMDDMTRRKHALGLLNKGLQHAKPSRAEFTAYGQGCLRFTQGILSLLNDHGALVFAVAIPKGIQRAATSQTADYLRKDYVLLLERYYYFLEMRNETGLLVMDETNEMQDRQFVRHLESYFLKTARGQYRAARIVPAPFFVSSNMTYPVQVADVCIYCINWGFRLPFRGMDAPSRSAIAQEFGPWLSRLQFQTEATDQHGNPVQSYSIVFVPDPYQARTDSDIH